MSGKKRTVATNLLRLDPKLQCRESVPEKVIKEYEEAWIDKVPFPPVDVYEIDGELFVTDGFCRVLAAQNVGKSRMEAIVTKGSWKDALRAACGANVSHGLRRTNEDKRKAALVALNEFPDETTREIAKLVGVSHTFIVNLRSQNAKVDSIIKRLENNEAPEEVLKDTPIPPKEKKKTVEEVLDVISPPGWCCSDCGGTEQRLSDGGNVCRACLCPVDAEPEEQEEVETFPDCDPIPEKIGAVHAAWGRFIRACDAAQCSKVFSTEIDAITKKLKGLK